MLFTKVEEAEAYSERYGDRYRVFGLDPDVLADRLGDSDFLCVMVDGRLKLRRDFIEELMRDA